MKSAYATLFAALAALLPTATAAAQAAPLPQGQPMMQGSCDQMMGRMMSSNGMMAGMAIGWILTVLLAIAAIFALWALGLYLLRRSRQFTQPFAEEPPRRASNDIRAATPA